MRTLIWLSLAVFCAAALAPLVDERALQIPIEIPAGILLLALAWALLGEGTRKAIRESIGLQWLTALAATLALATQLGGVWQPISGLLFSPMLVIVPLALIVLILLFVLPRAR